MKYITHDVYVRLLQYQSAPITYPLAYLYGVASHVLAGYRARIARKGTYLLIDSDAADESANACSTSADIHADEIDLKQRSTRVISLLSPTHVAVLLAQAQLGPSYDEIAETLGLSIHTVKKYVMQARATLRSISKD